MAGLKWKKSNTKNPESSLNPASQTDLVTSTAENSDAKTGKSKKADSKKAESSSNPASKTNLVTNAAEIPDEKTEQQKKSSLKKAESSSQSASKIDLVATATESTEKLKKSGTKIDKSSSNAASKTDLVTSTDAKTEKSIDENTEEVKSVEACLKPGCSHRRPCVKCIRKGVKVQNVYERKNRCPPETENSNKSPSQTKLDLGDSTTLRPSSASQKQQQQKQEKKKTELSGEENKKKSKVSNDEENNEKEVDNVSPAAPRETQQQPWKIVSKRQPAVKSSSSCFPQRKILPLKCWCESCKQSEEQRNTCRCCFQCADICANKRTISCGRAFIQDERGCQIAVPYEKTYPSPSPYRFTKPQCCCYRQHPSSVQMFQQACHCHHSPTCTKQYLP